MSSQRKNLYGLIGVIISIALLTVVANYDWWFGNGQERLASQHICTHLRAIDGIPCDETYVFAIYFDELDTCQKRIGAPDIQDTDDWLTCFQDNGIDLRADLSS